MLYQLLNNFQTLLTLFTEIGYNSDIYMIILNDSTLVTCHNTVTWSQIITFSLLKTVDNWKSHSSKKWEVYELDLFHSVSFYSLGGQSSKWGFDDPIYNQVKPCDFKTGRDGSTSKIRDLHWTCWAPSCLQPYLIILIPFPTWIKSMLSAGRWSVVRPCIAC